MASKLASRRARWSAASTILCWRVLIYGKNGRPEPNDDLGCDPVGSAGNDMLVGARRVQVGCSQKTTGSVYFDVAELFLLDLTMVVRAGLTQGSSFSPLPSWAR